MEEDFNELKEEFESFKTEMTKSVSDIKTRMDEEMEKFKNHKHDGNDSPHIEQADIIPTVRAAGSITMATNGQVYRLGIIDRPTQIVFTGVALNTVDGVRSQVVGQALLGQSFQFQPVDSNDVSAGGPAQNFIQNSSAFTIKVTATAAMVTTVSENHLVSVNWPTNSTIVARATVTEFGDNYVEVTVTLATNWSIVGNFTVT